MRPKLVKTSIWVLILAVVPLLAADFWEKKEYTTWSEKECMKLLRKSPWAFSESFRTTANLGSSETGVRETTEIIEFRLLTAKPIRMAFGQLQLRQDSGNESLKEQIMRYVEAPPGDEILVQVSCRTIPAGGFISHLDAFLAHATLSTFVNTTYLTSADGEHISMIKYLPKNDKRPNAVFVFPRLAEDEEPYFTGKEKSITFRSEFDMDNPGAPRDAVRTDIRSPTSSPLRHADDLLRVRKKYKIHFKMKPKKMMFQGEFAL
jgi:hypothetical protein